MFSLQVITFGLLFIQLPIRTYTSYDPPIYCECMADCVQAIVHYNQTYEDYIQKATAYKTAMLPKIEAVLARNAAAIKNCDLSSDPQHYLTEALWSLGTQPVEAQFQPIWLTEKNLTKRKLCVWIVKTSRLLHAFKHYNERIWNDTQIVKAFSNTYEEFFDICSDNNDRCFHHYLH